jgi:hypothetical protein
MIHRYPIDSNSTDARSTGDAPNSIRTTMQYTGSSGSSNIRRVLVLDTLAFISVSLLALFSYHQGGPEHGMWHLTPR